MNVDLAFVRGEEAIRESLFGRERISALAALRQIRKGQFSKVNPVAVWDAWDAIGHCGSEEAMPLYHFLYILIDVHDWDGVKLK